MLIKMLGSARVAMSPEQGGLEGGQVTADPVRGRHGLGVSSRLVRVVCTSPAGVENRCGLVGFSSGDLFTVHFGPDFV